MCDCSWAKSHAGSTVTGSLQADETWQTWMGYQVFVTIDMLGKEPIVA